MPILKSIIKLLAVLVSPPFQYSDRGDCYFGSTLSSEQEMQSLIEGIGVPASATGGHCAQVQFSLSLEMVPSNLSNVKHPKKDDLWKENDSFLMSAKISRLYPG